MRRYPAQMDWQRGARAGSFVVAVPVVLALWNAAHAALHLAPDGAEALALDALATAGLLALLAGAGASLSRQPLGTRLGLRRGRFGAPTLALTTLGLLGLSHAMDGFLTLFGVTESPSLVRIDTAVAGATPGALAFALAALALGSASAEELFFRGFVQRGLERSLGAAGAIAFAAVAFAAAHGDLAHTAAALPLGLYLGVLAWLDGSIRPALIAHVANNALAVLEAGLGLQLAETGGNALVSIIVAIIVGLAIAALALRVAGRGGTPPKREDPSPARVLAASGRSGTGDVRDVSEDGSGKSGTASRQRGPIPRPPRGRRGTR